MVLSQWGKKSKKMGSLRPTRETPEHYINDCIIALRERHHTELKRTDNGSLSKETMYFHFLRESVFEDRQDYLAAGFLS